MSSLLRTLLAVALVSFLPACGLKKGKEVATHFVDTFHQQFNDSKFTEIHSTATPAFQASVKEPEFLKFMEAVRRKLGAYKSGTQAGWRTNATTNGTFVVLTNNSEFDLGSAVETFTYVVSDETATLQGYNINSTALITN